MNKFGDIEMEEISIDFKGQNFEITTSPEIIVEGVFTSYDTSEQYLVSNIIKWHHDRNLVKGSTDKDQVLKLMQELGELSDSVCKGKDIRDDIGDMLVVMLNIMTRNNVTIEDCLLQAWNDIKDRKGRMIDGIFVKEQDL